MVGRSGGRVGENDGDRVERMLEVRLEVREEGGAEVVGRNHVGVGY